MKPFLSDVHWERKLVWAMGCRDWGVETWRDHIFTDKSTFETSKPNGSILAQRHSGEAYNEDCIHPTFKSGRHTSNHWGGIQYSGRSELICLCGEGRMTGAKYVEKFLQEELAFFHAHIEAHNVNPTVIVKDNSPCHGANVVMEYCEK